LSGHFNVGSGIAGLSAMQKVHDNRLEGMVDLEHVGSRVQTCVKCHVGTATAEVDHDLLAAGHPQLKFEFSNSLRRMERFAHWTESQDRVWHQPDSGARVWAVGQIETLRAALQLRQARLAQADKSWPEFAELDCRGCHHALTDAGEPSLAGSPAETLKFDNWHFAAYSTFAPVFAALSSHAPPKSRFHWSRDPAQRAAIIEQCHIALAELAPLAADLEQHKTIGAQRLLPPLVAQNPQTWNDSVQLYNALVAIHEQHPERAKLRSAAHRLRGALLDESGSVRFVSDEVGIILDDLRSLNSLVQP
jgi:hypothetical protein